MREKEAEPARSVARDAERAAYYHLGRDIGETTNLADREPAKVEQLATAWMEWNRANVAPLWYPSDPHPDRAAKSKNKKR